MCNTSKFQQQRKFNQLAEIEGGKFLSATQLSPRKFEVMIQRSDFKNTIYWVYFGDNEVTYKEPNKSYYTHWHILN